MDGPGKQPRLIISLGMHSAAIIAFQLALMQLISVAQWHHFAYMIISVAMLGFGASGTLLALFRSRLLGWSPWLVPLLMSLSGAMMMGAFAVARLNVFRFDVYLLFVDASQFPVLAANYLIFFLPFLTGALAIGILFIKNARHIGTYYFSNLLGSGAGGLLALLLAAWVHPMQGPVLIGLLSVGAGVLAAAGRRRVLLLLLNLSAIAVAGLLMKSPSDIPLSEYKSLARTMNLPEARIVHTRPDMQGLIQVVASPALRYAPALSLSHAGEAPVRKHLFVNGDLLGPIPRFGPETSGHILDHTTMALPYVMKERQSVAVLHAGTGAAVAQALARDARRVDAVMENRGVLRLLQTCFAEETGGMFLRDPVHAWATQVRHFLASAPAGHFDLIVLPLMDAFGGTAGLNALREDYSMTQEAFSQMWDCLLPDGVIAVSSWVDYPARTALKLLTTLVETARSKGVTEPRDHIAALRSWGTITFVLKKEPLDSAEVQRIRAFGAGMFFDPALLPGLDASERTAYNALDDPSLLEVMDRIMAGDPEVGRDYAFMIRPATDDKPYFSQFLRLDRLRQLGDAFGQQQLPFLELGFLIVLVTLLQGLLLALLLILLPLYRLKRSPRKKTGTLLYFGAIGLGYMFVEIILIQRFVLYLGHPVFALTSVISTMLIASGAGSLLSDRLRATPRLTARLALAVAGLMAAYALLLPPLIQGTLPDPPACRILISLLVIGLPAFVMGMLFPLGVRHLSLRDSSQIPWAWGINGCLSVVSTSVATLIAVEAGFRAVMGVAIGSYLLASAVFFLHGRLFGERTG
jgi:hypothetical protein